MMIQKAGRALAQINNTNFDELHELNFITKNNSCNPLSEPRFYPDFTYSSDNFFSIFR
jgi:hypothetical protein